MTHAQIDGDTRRRASRSGAWSLMAAAAAMAIVLLVAACGGAAATSSPASASVPATSPTVQVTPPPSAGPDVFTGSWATGAVTCAQEHSAVIAAGITEAQWQDLKSFTETDAEGCPVDSEGVRTLRFQGDQAVLLGPDASEWDSFGYAIVDGRTFLATDKEQHTLTWNYILEGDTLNLMIPTIDEVRSAGLTSSETELIGILMQSITAYQAAPFIRHP